MSNISEVFFLLSVETFSFQNLTLIDHLGSNFVLKVSKYRKQNTKFSHPKKKPTKFCKKIFALAFKKWSKQTIKALDDLN